MRYHVSVAGVSDETLEFIGYVLVHEDEYTKVYYHFGSEVVVDKSDPFIAFDDVNDLPFLKTDVIAIPSMDEDC